jgi:hypothetical protein
MVIHHHKNDHKGKKIIDIFDDELVECLRKGLYQSSSALQKCLITSLMTIHRMINGKRYRLNT